MVWSFWARNVRCKDKHYIELPQLMFCTVGSHSCLYYGFAMRTYNKLDYGSLRFGSKARGVQTL